MQRVWNRDEVTRGEIPPLLPSDERTGTVQHLQGCLARVRVLGELGSRGHRDEGLPQAPIPTPHQRFCTAAARRLARLRKVLRNQLGQRLRFHVFTLHPGAAVLRLTTSHFCFRFIVDCAQLTMKRKLKHEAARGATHQTSYPTPSGVE